MTLPVGMSPRKKNTQSHIHTQKKTNNKPVIRVIDYGNVNNNSINHRWSKKERNTGEKKKESTTDSSKVSSPSSITRERERAFYSGTGELEMAENSRRVSMKIMIIVKYVVFFSTGCYKKKEKRKRMRS